MSKACEFWTKIPGFVNFFHRTLHLSKEKSMWSFWIVLRRCLVFKKDKYRKISVTQKVVARRRVLYEWIRTDKVGNNPRFKLFCHTLTHKDSSSGYTFDLTEDFRNWHNTKCVQCRFRVRHPRWHNVLLSRPTNRKFRKYVAGTTSTTTCIIGNSIGPPIRCRWVCHQPLSKISQPLVLSSF